MNNPSPLRYPGGKNSLFSYVSELITSNDIDTYIEPYAGGAALPIGLIETGTVKKIVINDLDPGIYSFWKSVFEDTDSLIDKIVDVPVTIEEWYRQKEIYTNSVGNTTELGFATFFLNRTNRSGIIEGGPIGGYNQQSQYLIDCRFNKKKLIEKIVRVSQFSNRVKVYNLDAVELIKRSITRTNKSLTFFDPPYFNKGANLYRNYYQPLDHILLADTIKGYMNKHKWILTYDVDPFIFNLYNSFETFRYNLPYTAGKRKKGAEYMFFSKNLSSTHIDEYLNIEGRK